MAKGQVVFVVGHARWGKSRTLRAFAGGSRRLIQLRGIEFFIRRMSNDDRPKEFYDFIRQVRPSDKPGLIVAFCPKFQEPQTRRCLERLRQKGYKLFFWVLRQQYGDEQFVKPNEIATLRKYGRVRVYESGHREADIRARALRIFIENTVLV